MQPHVGQYLVSVMWPGSGNVTTSDRPDLTSVPQKEHKIDSRVGEIFRCVTLVIFLPPFHSLNSRTPKDANHGGYGYLGVLGVLGNVANNANNANNVKDANNAKIYIRIYIN
jgi:hypothetical protein